MNAVCSFFPHLYSRVKGFFDALWQAVRPGPKAVRGAGRGVLLVCGLAYLLFIILGAKGPLEAGVVMAVAILALGALLLFLGQGLAKLVKWIGKIPWGLRRPIELTVLLKDASGETAALPLSRYLPVQPQLSARLYKFSLLEPKATSEPILQSYVLPLADFVQANPRFHPEALRTIRFGFDRTTPGFVVLDGVGVR